MISANFVYFVFLTFALLDLGSGSFVYVTFEGFTLKDYDRYVSNSVCGQFSALSGQLPSSEPIKVTSLSTFGCSEYSDKRKHMIEENALFVLRGGCSFDTKITQAANANASLLLVASATPLPIPRLNNAIIGNYSLPLLVVPKSSFQFVNSLYYSKISVEQLSEPSFNLNKVVLFFLAMIPLLIGSLLGGCDAEFLKYGLLQRKGEVTYSFLEDFPQEDGKGFKGQFGLVLYILCLVGFMVAFLLGLYFFYEYFVWISIAVFCVSSSLATYTVLSPFAALIKFLPWRIPQNKLPIFKYRPDPKFFILSLASIILPVWWVACRQSQYAYILQDTLGCFLIIYILSILPFKTSISFLIPLLCVLVGYDVFFVFITPLFTPDGRSVMEYVAFGPDGSTPSPLSNYSVYEVGPYAANNNENIPFLFLAPYVTISPDELACQFPQIYIAGLGFGDVALPGLYLTYCLYYDILRERRFKLTYLVCIVSYMVSLVIAFVVSYVTKMGQPALLYLVPSIIVSTLLLSIIRGDFRDFLFGRRKNLQFLLSEGDYLSDEDKFDLNFVSTKQL